MSGHPDDRAGGNPNPTPLDQYDAVMPVDAWSITTGIDPNTGDVFPVLGFRTIQGRWGGLRLHPEMLSDMTIEPGKWLTEYAQAHDDGGNPRQERGEK